MYLSRSVSKNPVPTAVNHSDIPIAMDHDDRQPPIATPAVPGHFLDEAEDEAEGRVCSDEHA